jgi:hypothetical protein
MECPFLCQALENMAAGLFARAFQASPETCGLDAHTAAGGRWRYFVAQQIFTWLWRPLCRAFRIQLLIKFH